MRPSALGACLVAFAFFTAACSESPPPRSSPAGANSPVHAAERAARPRPRAEVTLLYTTDEHGWLAPAISGGKERGGAARVLGLWRANEGVCGERAKCPDAPLLLSGGDNYTGPALSSYFNGEPMAEALARMGYSASAFGNHEFDFGRAQFVANRQRAGLVYLAANVHASDPALKEEMDLPGYAIFEQRGIKIGVIGLATESTLSAAMASRFEGVRIEPMEPSLDRVVSDAWASDPDVLVLIAHECPTKLAPMLERHPDWGLSFVGGGHCHKVIEREVGGVPLVSPGWRLESYLRVRIDVDPARPSRKRALSVDPVLVEVSAGESAPPADAELELRAAAWQKKLDLALGEQIGFSAMGIEKDAPALGQWIARAWREELKVDVAIANSGGVRQALSQGAITLASVYSILPFDNKLVICRIRGRELLAELENDEAIASGLVRAGESYRLANGAPLDPERIYSVVTTDFMYYGGDHFRFRDYDPAATETGIDWRAPVIAWTKKQKTSPASPLERLFEARPRKAEARPLPRAASLH